MNKWEKLAGRVLEGWEDKAKESGHMGWFALKIIVFGKKADVMEFLDTSSEFDTEQAEDAARKLYVRQEKFAFERGTGSYQSHFSYVTKNLVEKMQKEYRLLKKRVNLTPEEMIGSKEIIKIDGSDEVLNVHLLKTYHRILVAAMIGMAESYIAELAAEDELPARYERMDKDEIVDDIFLRRSRNSPPLIVTLMNWADRKNINITRPDFRGKEIKAVADRLKKVGQERIRFQTNMNHDFFANIPLMDRQEEKDRREDYYERSANLVEVAIEDAMKRDDILSEQQKELIDLIIGMQAERADRTIPTTAEIAAATRSGPENISQRLSRIGAALIVAYDLDREMIARNFGLSNRIIRELEKRGRGSRERE